MSDREFLEVNLKFLRYCGCHPLKDSANFMQRLLYDCYVGLTLITFTWILIGVIVDVYNKFHLNMSEYTFTIINIGVYNCGLLSVLFCVYNANKAKLLLDEIQRKFKHETTNHLENKNMKVFNKFNLIFTFAFGYALVFSASFMAILPLFGDWSKLKLPVCDWCPIDLAQPFAFPIAYLLQIYAQVLVAGLCAAIDTFFVSMVALVAYQFTLVGCEFRNCVYNALIDSGLENERIVNFRKQFETTEPNDIDASLENAILTKNFNVSLHIHLIPVIEYHLELLTFAKKIENHFWSLIFMKVITSLFYHVFMGFAIVTAKDSSLFFGIGQYETCALLELLMFAIVGQFLMTKSEEVGDYVYESPWYVCSKSHVVSLKMVMMRSTRVCKLSIGKLSDLTLPAFVTIMRTAVSYLAVLRQVTRE